jgi:hypothetical protein
MSELTNKEYKKILDYYNKPIPYSKSLLKKHAENILAEKLCRCIKKLDPEKEARSIGICTKTVINRKGYTRGKFQCKGKKSITIKKRGKNRK